MAKYKVTFDRENCIGAATCTAVSDNWKIVEDGKADYAGAKKNSQGLYEKIIDEKSLDNELQAAQACPVNVIHIENLETKEKLV